MNFVLGNLIGLSEVDVQSVELLPGASSALYGANAFNGFCL
jgi:outer membrane receptor protein involved in Fe transport